jgi:hypothetical protein
MQALPVASNDPKVLLLAVTRTADPVVPFTIEFTASSSVSEPTIAYVFATGSALAGATKDTPVMAIPKAANIAATFLVITSDSFPLLKARSNSCLFSRVGISYLRAFGSWDYSLSSAGKNWHSKGGCQTGK